MTINHEISGRTPGVAAEAGGRASARRAWQRALPLLSELGHDLPAFESFAAEDDSSLQ